MPGTRITRKRAIVVGVIAAGTVAVGAIVLGGGGSDNAATAAAPSTATATTAIKRQDLVEVDTENGTLGYSDTRSVVNRLSGTVTWLASVGSTVHTDHALYKVDGSPVILMNGSLPAYRTLKAGITRGVDIRQLEHTLRAHGYDSGHDMTVDRSWSAATTAAVKRWQKAHGLSQTGEITLGQIVFLPGARRVASTSATLGGSSGSTGSAGGGATTTGASLTTNDTPAVQTVATSRGEGSAVRLVNAAYRTTAQQQTTSTPGLRVVAAATETQTTPSATTTTPSSTTTTTPAPTTTTPAPATPTTTTPQTTTTPKTTTKPKTTATPKSTATPSAGSSSSSSTAGVGAQAAPAGTGGGGGSASSASSGSAASSAGAASASGGQSSSANTIMTTTSRRRVVTVALATTKAAIAKLGERVTVKLPSGSDVHGRISSIGKVATSTAASSDSGSSSSSSAATIKVTIHLSRSRGGLDQAPVTVRFEQSRRRAVLAIPVTALLARPGDVFAVQVLQADGTLRTVAVQTGLYTSGYVEIMGDGLRAGQRVTNAAVE